jgi:hypothetical protein
LLAYHLEGDQEHISRQLRKAAGFTSYAAHSVSQSRKELLFISGARNFRAGSSHRRQSVCVAPANCYLVPLPRKVRGVFVRAFEHVAVVRLDRRKILFEPREVL